MSSKKKHKSTARQKGTSSQTKPKKSNSKKWLVLSGILLFTFLCYAPSLNNGFVNWDDGENFLENELITGLSNNNFWELTIEIFKTDVLGNYNPLSIWTFLIENKVYGLDNPTYWHLDNILLHLVCCMFVFWIGLRLRLGLAGTAFLTLLFAIHPMRVESVAWITERKDVLFGAFYLAALYFYIKGRQDGFRKRDYIIISVCFMLSLLSKIQAVTLPVSMVLVDYYLMEGGKLKLKHILNKWPYFLASLAVGLLGVFLLENKGATDLSYSGISRVFIGSYSLLVYYIKSLFPFRLSPLYPYPNALGWQYYISILSFIVSAYLLWKSYRKQWKPVFFGLGFFLANIVLLLQVLGAGHGFLADRFTYIPYFGLFFLYAYYLEKAYVSRKHLKIPILAVSSATIVIFSILCFNQNKIWKNSDTLWTHVLKYYDNADTPWANRAIYYRDNGMFKKALHDYSQYIKLDPDNPDAYNSKARLYFNFQNRDSLLKALDNFNTALSLRAEDTEFLVNRGATYAKLGQKEKALNDFKKAEEIDPSYHNIYLNRSLLYNNSEDWKNAVVDISKYLDLKPYNYKMWLEKSRLHMILKQFEQWLEASNKAISMKPNDGLCHYERARGWYYFKKYDEAKTSMKMSLKLGYKKGNQQLIDSILNQ